MMEVKQSTPVPLMDFVSSNSNTNSQDADVILNKTVSRQFSTENSKDSTRNGSYGKSPTIENPITELDDDLEFHDAIDLTETMNSDLEDALLAGDELPSSVNPTKKVDKIEIASDPGAALDKLLSKISDIVDVHDESTTKLNENKDEMKTSEIPAKEVVEKEVKETTVESMDVDANESILKDELDDDVVMIEPSSNAEETSKHDKKNEEKETAESSKNSEDEEKEEKEKVENEKEKEEEKQKENETIEEGKQKEKEHETIEKENKKETEILTIDVDLEEENNENEDENENENENKKKTEVESENDKKKEKEKETKAEEEVVNIVDNENDEKTNNVGEEKRENKDETNKETAIEIDEKKDPTDKSTSEENFNENEISTTDEIVNETKEISEEVKISKIATENLEKEKDEAELESKEKTQQQDDIPILTLDDDDDDEALVSSSTNEVIKPDTVSKLKNNAVSTNDDEVVCLDDDDDDEMEIENNKDTAIKPTEESKLSKEEDTKEMPLEKEAETVNEESAIISDNTDNACDGLGAEATAATAKNVEKEIVSENDENVNDAASECSNSSNLLQETKAPSEVTYEERDEPEDEEADADDGDDVELIEDTTEVITVRNSEEKELDASPPAKRIRLSTEDESSKNSGVQISTQKENLEVQVSSVESLEKPAAEVISSEKQSAKDVNLTTSTMSTPAVALKRSFSETEENSSEKQTESTEEESANKKLKTVNEEQLKLEQKSEVIEIDTECKSELLEKTKKEEVDENLTDLKFHPLSAIGSDKPIPLYPAPKFNEAPAAVPLEFLKRFKKSFNQMTKNDLEELVLQKIVEALVHENEFAELRSIIEKQEKVIASHRTKLSQLSKQFRDLEMVHTRVVKDMREKNKQYLMPVRITRAVGLQVSSLNLRKDLPLGGPAQSSQTSNMPTPRSPQYNNTDIPQQRTSPQRPGNILQSNNTGISTVSSSNVRRGCVQKITAQRPVEVTSSTTNPPMSSIPASFLRPIAPKPVTAQLSQASQSPQTRILNKNISGMPQQVIGNSRPRYSGGSSPVPQEQLQQQNQRKTSLMHQQAMSRQQNNSNIIKATTIIPPHKGVSQQQQYRRSDSTPLPTTTIPGKSTSSVMDQYKNSYNQPITGIPSVSITPARPKDKSVIDLTDEDDVASSLTPAQLNNSGSSRIRTSPQIHVNNVGNANRNSTGVGGPTPTRLPVNLNSRPQISARQLSSLQAQKPINQSKQVITPPAGTSITRVSVSSSSSLLSQRLKYQHPAPLPPTPPQTFDPSWKLPPPRPTIRINNLDNGIVISWTMEESLERHADCVTYQIYAYQETNGPPSVESWRHVGDVKAMLLPMAVTLTQFQEGQRYYFAVRAVDIHHRIGAFSTPQTWN